MEPDKLLTARTLPADILCRILGYRHLTGLPNSTV